ncbi:MAG: PAS domain-containing protein, partial [Planctomycetota bacterium]
MDDAHSNRKPVKKRSAEPNSESRECRGSILQALPIALIVFDADLKIIEANSKATSLVKLRDR